MIETDKQKVIDQTKEYIKARLRTDPTGHDWWHTYRVWRNALYIGELEKANLFVVQLAALLHDIADYKLNNGDDTLGPKLAAEWLENLGVTKEVIAHVSEIISDMSFKGANVESKMRTREGMVVQDADRLDALGAIGIARTFAYGGYKGRLIHDPNIQPKKHNSFDEYKKNLSPSINHFYEKQLLLKDLMNTEAGRRVAEKRHNFIVEFLREFFSEWEGEDASDNTGVIL